MNATGERVAGRAPMRIGPVSTIWRPRPVLVVAAGLVVLVLAAAANVGRGDFPLSVGQVLAVLGGGGDDGQRFIVVQLRLPRSVTGALVGAALGLSGAILQTIARNPLASPDVLGITNGAAAAALAFIVTGGGAGAAVAGTGTLGLPLAALAGGVASAALLYALSWRRGLQGFRFVLVGIGLNLVFVALVQWALVAADVQDAARAEVWLNGSLNGRGWEHVVPLTVALAVLGPAALVLAFVLGALQFGDDTARGLGVRVDRARAALLGVAVALAAVATAAAGPIAFVALVAPQVAVRLVHGSRPPLVASLVLGAALTVTADLVARTVWGSTDLPVGIVTAVLGAPYLLFLLARHRREVRV